MKSVIMLCSVLAILCGLPAFAQTGPAAAAQIVALERQAMDGWLKGNPDPALALADPDITYFHIMTEKRLDGLPPLKALFETYRGTPLFDSYEIAEPKVQISGDTAVLTYILVRHLRGAASRWNATQVYQRKKENWRIIHTHFSQTMSQ
jgi:ketosteroid isomerase-like protein